jgi:enoyl-CoA hydratase/carnithine racemase
MKVNMNAIQISEKNGITTLTFDLPGEKVNKLSTAVMLELQNHLEKIKN